MKNKTAILLFIIALSISGCSSLTIYAEASAKPSGWKDNWNSNYRPVVWGYTG